jgi:hypothetical protein
MKTTGSAPRTLLVLSPRRTLRFLLAAAAVVTLAMIAGELSRAFAIDDSRPAVRFLRVLRRNFSPSGEQTVEAWLTAATLLVCGLLLFVAAASARASGGRFVGHWRALGAIFVFLSCDEIVGLHEQLGDWVREQVTTGGPLLWAWVIPYSAFAAAAALAYVPFLRHLPPDSLRRFLAAGALFVGGALVLEMVQAWIVDARGRGGGPVSVLAVIEETAELAGAIFFLYALLEHLAIHGPGRIAIHVAGPVDSCGSCRSDPDRSPAADDCG